MFHFYCTELRLESNTIREIAYAQEAGKIHRHEGLVCGERLTAANAN
jgi:hypothetical protein